MRRRGLGFTRDGRTLGVTLLILSLVHTPLPQPDFHNIRHHDAPGEVCEHHDHLLRWHPGAGRASDVAVLHWHWFLQGPPGTDPVSEGAGTGPALHAHAPAWEAAVWDEGPRLTPDTASRLLARAVPCPLALPFAPLPDAAPGASPAAGMRPPLAFGAAFAPGVSLTAMLHRWVC